MGRRERHDEQGSGGVDSSETAGKRFSYRRSKRREDVPKNILEKCQNEKSSEVIKSERENISEQQQKGGHDDVWDYQAVDAASP